MDLTAINPHLPDHRKPMLAGVVETIEDGIAAGVVRNKDFTRAKEVINWSVDEAAAAFLKSGPGKTDTERGLWGRCYDAYAFAHSAHEVPAALKKARKAGNLNEYATFLEAALLPLHALLQAAKPMVVKRGEAGHPPEPMTPEQIAREAAQMTCQCCGGRFLANTGTMAHHGYKRPGSGWQTASCSGAKALPFEVSRESLGAMIEGLRVWEKEATGARNYVHDERMPVALTYTDKREPTPRDRSPPKKIVRVTRETFNAVRKDVEAEQSFGTFSAYGWTSFDKVKEDDVVYRERQIAGVRDEIAFHQARYDGWKQTHRWDAEAKEWTPIIATAAA